MKDGWEMKKLVEICEKTTNIKWKEHNDETFFYIDLSSVSRDTFKIQTKTEINLKNAPSRAKKIVNKSDVIFATTRPTLKRVAIIPDDFDNQICSTGFAVLRPKKNIIQGKYIFYFIQSDKFMDRMEKLQRGASYPAVTDSEVKKTFIPIPPLPEQKKIVTLLDTAFAKIDQAQANIEKNIANAQDLFYSKKGQLFLKLAKESKSIALPNVCEEIFAGGDAPKENYSKEKTEEFNIPIIANAVKNRGLYGYTNYARVTEPSITVAARGSGTGHTEIRLVPFLPIVRLIVLTPKKEKVNLDYLKHAILNLVITRSGSAIPQLTIPMIKKYSIPVPIIRKQENLVEELTVLDSQLTDYKLKLQSKLQSLEQLKKSLLQKAFTGELTT